MNYMMIRTDDMLNGDGLRVVLFCTGCEHHCNNCHNPETWNPSNGCLLNNSVKEKVYNELGKDYISGITISGGDPLHYNNLADLYSLLADIKYDFPNKTIWLYTGYTWEQIMYSVTPDDFSPDRDSITDLRREIVYMCDVVVDGKYIDELKDVKYPWAGSTNQRVIDVKKTLETGVVIRWVE